MFDPQEEVRDFERFIVSLVGTLCGIVIGGLLGLVVADAPSNGASGLGIAAGAGLLLAIVGAAAVLIRGKAGAFMGGMLIGLMLSALLTGYCFVANRGN